MVINYTLTNIKRTHYSKNISAPHDYELKMRNKTEKPQSTGKIEGKKDWEQFFFQSEKLDLAQMLAGYEFHAADAVCQVHFSKHFGHNAVSPDVHKNENK